RRRRSPAGCRGRPGSRVGRRGVRRRRGRSPALLHHLPRAARGHPLRPVPLRARPQVLLPLHAGLHPRPGRRQRGLLPQRGEVPAGGLQHALGLHAGGDLHHPGRRRQGEEGARPVTASGDPEALGAHRTPPVPQRCESTALMEAVHSLPLFHE
ncbi:hypothetical protein AAFF_G00037930, partial [Aldrovandia affinis]